MDNGHEAQPLVVQSMPEGNDQVTCGHFKFVPLSLSREKKEHNECDKKGKNILRLKAGETLNSFLKVG